MKCDLARTLERVQRLDGRCELHAVVGRLGLATVHSLAVVP